MMPALLCDRYSLCEKDFLFYNDAAEYHLRTALCPTSRSLISGSACNPTTPPLHLYLDRIILSIVLCLPELVCSFSFRRARMFISSPFQLPPRLFHGEDHCCSWIREDPSQLSSGIMCLLFQRLRFWLGRLAMFFWRVPLWFHSVSFLEKTLGFIPSLWCCWEECKPSWRDWKPAPLRFICSFFPFWKFSSWRT